MNKKRVVVTGMGIVSCFGTDVDHFYDSLLALKSGVTPIDSFDCEDYPTRFAASVRDFEVGDYMDKKQARRVDPFIRYTVVAGKKALEHAGLSSLDNLDKSRCGVLIGSGMGGMSTFYDGNKTIQEKGFKRLTPFFVPYIITNMGSGLLAIDLGFQGPCYSISTACATGTYSVQAAAQHIQRGDTDLIVCGGAEAAINPIGVAGFVACKALSQRNDDMEGASRPWDTTRDGFVMGDGCGALILESLEHAKARGATIYGEYLGGAFNCDAHHMTSPHEDGSGVAACIELAVKDAGIEKSRVNYINAHATSTLVGDLCEIRAIRSAFGDHVKNIKVNGTKSLIGHCLGAAGGIEAIVTVMAIHRGELHGTRNVKSLEEEVRGIDVLTEGSKKVEIDVALSNSFGFGGHNAVLVFGKYNP